MDAWNANKSHVLLAKVGPYKVFYPDVFPLGPGRRVRFIFLNSKGITASPAQL